MKLNVCPAAKYIFVVLSIAYLFLLQACTCGAPEAFNSEDAMDWVRPFEDEDMVFVSQDSIPKEIIVKKDYEEGEEYIGGDECGAINQTFKAFYTIQDTAQTLLLICRSFQEVVFFDTDDVNESIYSGFAGYNAAMDTFYFADYDIRVVQKDTLIQGENRTRIHFTFWNSNRIMPNFHTLTYVKGIGITQFTDKTWMVWDRK